MEDTTRRTFELFKFALDEHAMGVSPQTQKLQPRQLVVKDNQTDYQRIEYCSVTFSWMFTLTLGFHSQTQKLKTPCKV